MNLIKVLRRIKNDAHTSVLFVLYFISKFTKRDYSLWLFGSGFGYADNSKYYFEEVKKIHPEIHAIWLSKSKEQTKQLAVKGIEAYYNFSWKGICLGLKAGVYIYTHRTSDINFFTSGGKIFKFDLWHGVAMKQIEYTITNGAMKSAFSGTFKSKFHNPYNYQKPDLLLSPGKKCDEIFKRSFLVGQSRLVHSVYPRCKQFFLKKKDMEENLEKLGGIYYNMLCLLKKFNKSYIYMPTFRDSHGNFLEEAGFNLQKLNDALKKNNALFIIKVHPATFPYLGDIPKYSNIYIVKKQFDIYPLLPFFDTLITDYSSIYFDYLLLNSEIILFPFDIENYQKKDRPFLFDYDKNIKGRKVYTFDNLIKLIDKNEDCHLTKGEYQEMKEWFTSDDNVNDLTNFIKNRISSK